MEPQRHTPVSRFVALILIVGGHALLVMLSSDDRTGTRGASAEPKSPTTLFFVELPPSRTALPAQAAPTLPRGLGRSTTTPRNLSDVVAPEPEISTSPAPLPPTDWHLEAERIGREKAPELLERELRKCADSEVPGLPPPECRKRDYEPHWKPEPKKFGFANGLPYVRLGKRCAVGLGFFACAIGKLPEANGHLFDDMSDPNRPTSSVPDIPGRESR